MRALLQRVTRAKVTVDGQVVGAIDSGGWCILLGIGQGDDQAVAAALAKRVVNLRMFSDAAGKFNKSLLDVGGSALVVSQFTLYADTSQGRRPSFTQAAPPDTARTLYEYFMVQLRELGVAHVAGGQFAAHMQVEIHNDGPVTIWLDTNDQ